MLIWPEIDEVHLWVVTKKQFQKDCWAKQKIYKEILSLYLANNFKMIKLQSGKPMIFPSCGLEISISHKKNMYVLAISRNSIGVDIEVADSRVDFLNIAFRFFPEISEYISGLKNDILKHRLAIAGWCQLEAYIKLSNQSLRNILLNVDYVNKIFRMRGKNYHVETVSYRDYIIAIASNKQVVIRQIMGRVL